MTEHTHAAGDRSGDEADHAPGRAATDDRRPVFTAARLTSWSIVLTVLFLALIFGRSFLIPLVIAGLIWILMNALHRSIRRIPVVGASMPSWLSWTASIGAVLLLLYVIYAILASQSAAMIEAAPRYQQNLDTLIAKVTDRVGLEETPSIAELTSRMDFGGMLATIGGSLGSLLGSAVLVAVYVAFLLLDQAAFPRKLERLARSREDNEKTIQLFQTMAARIQQYVLLKTGVSLLTGVISYVILRFIGVDFAATWAMLIFLLNFIPNIGSILAVAFPAILALVQFDTFTPFFLVVGGLGLVQFAIGNGLEPAIMGRSLNLSSFVIILSLTFWGTIWGIAGMFLCVPIMVVVAIACSHFDGLRPFAVMLSSDGRIDGDPPASRDGD